MVGEAAVKAGEVQESRHLLRGCGESECDTEELGAPLGADEYRQNRGVAAEYGGQVDDELVRGVVERVEQEFRSTMVMTMSRFAA